MYIMQLSTTDDAAVMTPGPERTSFATSLSRAVIAVLISLISCPCHRDRDGRYHGGRDYDRGLADGRCRGPRGPSVPRAFPTLHGSGRNVGDSSRPPHTGDGPSAL